MSPRNLFIIILRVIGLFFARDLVLAIPTLLSEILYASARSNNSVSSLALSGLIVLVYVVICWGLVFKPGALVDKLKLDKGFNEEIITMNIHRSTILSISLIIIGGLVLIDSIPALCRHLMTYYLQTRDRYGNENPTISWTVLDAVRVIIGFLLIAEKRRIVNFIEYKGKTRTSDT